MAAPTKVVNETEVQRWYEEGRTYRWIVAEYERKYGITTTVAMWGNLRTRRGWERRAERDDTLVPWHVEREHIQAYPLAMLRVEGRRRAGKPLRPSDVQRVESWTRKVRDAGLVVDYHPAEGFALVPARDGEDLVREPDAALRKVRARVD